jgi:hypothetical protein
VTDGAFEEIVDVERGENLVTVAAASGADLEAHRTTVRRLRL